MDKGKHVTAQETSVPVSTPHGDGEIQALYISELGFLMAKVYFKENGVWITWNLGQYDIRKSPLFIGQRATLLPSIHSRHYHSLPSSTITVTITTSQRH